MKSIAIGVRLIFTMVALLAAGQVSAADPVCPAVLNHSFKSLQGETMNLCTYTGKVVLVVNTASFCGYTKQYKGLQAIYDRYQARGLVVLGFPANDFGQQEPGSNAEVADFCERTYRVKFPMVEKTSVVAGKANPVYEKLAEMTGERPKWNFHKYLLSRDGKSARSFSSKTDPESADFLAQVEKLLAEK